MAYLIDGSNVLGHLAPERLRSAAGRRMLASRLLTFQGVRRARITLVFDGPPDSELEDRIQSRRGFRILFPPPGEKADGIIRNEIRQGDRNLRVVSTDREIRDFARTRGARVLSAEEFLKILKPVLREARRAGELRKDDPRLSPLEVRLWSEVFDDRD